MNRNDLIVAMRDVNFRAVTMLSALGLLATLVLPNPLGPVAQLLQASM